jgi:hypothetical protein
MKMLFKYTDTCYGFTTFLFVGDKEELQNTAYKAPIYFGKESLDDFVSSIKPSHAGMTVHLVLNETYDRYLVWLPSFDFSVEALVTLSHECLHVASLALMQRDVSDFNNEGNFHAMMYLKDSIERAFLYALNRHAEKEKKKLNENIESVVNPQEESTADYEMKKEMEKEETKSKKNTKK